MADSRNIEFSTTIFRRLIAKNILMLGEYEQRYLTAKYPHFLGHKRVFSSKNAGNLFLWTFLR